jgi:hypothetical protein
MKEAIARKTELIAICARHQGEHIAPGHPRTSWATCYGNEFVAAAAELYALYSHLGHRMALGKLSEAFQRNGIRSCRGSRMTLERIEYLFKTHVGPRIAAEGRKTHRRP